MWEFGRANLNLNTNTSTVHVPTNIYDKCELYFICCSFLTVTTPPPLPPLSPPLPKEKVRSGIISRKDNCNSHCLESDYICNFGGNSTGICHILYWIGVFNLSGIPAACTTSVVIFLLSFLCVIFVGCCFVCKCVFFWWGVGEEGREMGGGGGWTGGWTSEGLEADTVIATTLRRRWAGDIRLLFTPRFEPTPPPPTPFCVPWLTAWLPYLMYSKAPHPTPPK